MAFVEILLGVPTEDSRLLGHGLMDVAITRTINYPEFNWLGNVPLDVLIRLREDGTLQDLRDLFRRELYALSQTTDSEFERARKLVHRNLDEALKNHEAQIKYLANKYSQSLKLDLTSFVISGTLTIASAFVPYLAIPGALFGGAGLADFLRQKVENRSEARHLKTLPSGILFEAMRKG